MSKLSAAEPPVSAGAEGVHAVPRKTGLRLLDLSVALSAIVISLISLSIGIHHGHVQEQLVAANSWPFLRWEHSNDFDERGQRFTIYITNAGVGPAVLKALVVRYKGEPVHGWFELLQKCCGVVRQEKLDLPAIGFFTGGAPKGVLLPQKQRTLISLIRLPQRPQYWQRLGAARLDLTFEACYCSIIGECWKSDLRTLDPERTEQCESGPNDYVEVGAGFDEITELPELPDDFSFTR